jgi:hypothetical protein
MTVVFFFAVLVFFMIRRVQELCLYANDKTGVKAAEVGQLEVESRCSIRDRGRLQDVVGTGRGRLNPSSLKRCMNR